MYGHSELTEAVLRGDEGAVRQACANGADVQAFANFALHRAVRSQHHAVVAVLLQQDADPLAREGEMVETAICLGDVGMLKLLLDSPRCTPLRLRGMAYHFLIRPVLVASQFANHGLMRLVLERVCSTTWDIDSGFHDDVGRVVHGCCVQVFRAFKTPNLPERIKQTVAHALHVRGQSKEFMKSLRMACVSDMRLRWLRTACGAGAGAGK
jgi:hypothetical protein